jgi:predicted transcriptional regulator
MVKSRRLNIRVTETLAKQLEHEARQHGVTMTAIIEAAIQRYCDDEVSEPPEALILRRLDRIDRSQANAERGMAEVIERLKHYILYWLERRAVTQNQRFPV